MKEGFVGKKAKKMAITLNNGFQMPVMGLGVWRMEKHKIKDLILNAIQLGYRHFDCAGNLLSPFFLSIKHNNRNALYIDISNQIYEFLSLNYIM